jgi:Ca-activated chloride channel family protein
MRSCRALAALAFALAAVASVHPRAAAVGGTPLAVRITSPLGRTGIPGTVRIVAQIHAEPEAVLKPVQFFVDEKLLATDTDGPPYAVEWVDENPFEPKRIEVEVADDHGNSARDAISLKPLEVYETSQVTSVLLEATVQDKGGRFIGNLQPGDFQVREDGVPQTLELARREELPATFALLIDSSQSMSRRIDFVKEAASRLTGYLAARDTMLVVPFSKHVEPITGPTQDRATVEEAIGGITANGGTAILDSLIEVAPHFKDVEGRRVIVLVTDGYDEHSESRFDDALAAVKSAGATVYVVGIGGVAGISLKGERFLRRLAAETGGRMFMPSRDEDLALAHDALASDVHQRYLLTYTPSNQTIDGAWRAVTLTTSKPEYVVRTRKGYFAPKPAPVRPSIEFTITDNEDRFVDIGADDLTVVENGVEQKVDTFQEAVSPVSVVLALDASGSMKKAASVAQDAARRFVQALRPEDQLATVQFADKSEVVHELSKDRQLSLSAIDTYQAKGGTALYDALCDSLIRLKQVEGRRVVVVVTDGRDEDNPGTGPGSVQSFDDVLRYVKENDAVVYGIGIGEKVDRARLEMLAAASGGQAYFPEDASQLDEPYRRVVEHLRRRWVLVYTSTNSKHDGSWRSVEIRTDSPNAVVRSRGGYFAPDK